MHVYDDGVEVETVELHTLKTKELLHALMLEKGFQRQEVATQDTQPERTIIDIPTKPSRQEQADMEQRLLERSILLGSNKQIGTTTVSSFVLGRQSVPVLCGLSSLVLLGIYFGRRRVMKPRSN